MSRTTHRERILDLLRQRPMTTIELQDETGILRIHPRIGELRQEGWDIRVDGIGEDGSSIYHLYGRIEVDQKVVGITIRQFSSNNRWDIRVHSDIGGGMSRYDERQLERLREAILETCERWAFEETGLDSCGVTDNTQVEVDEDLLDLELTWRD